MITERENENKKQDNQNWFNPEDLFTWYEFFYLKEIIVIYHDSIHACI